MDKNIVSLFHCDDANGTDAKGFATVQSKSLATVSGKFGKANTGYMTFPSGQWDDFLLSSAWTIDFWVYPRQANNFDVVLCLGSWGGGYGWSTLRFEPHAKADTCTYWLDRNGAHLVTGAEIKLLSAQWSHIAFVFNKNVVSFYINGEMKRSDSLIISSCGPINCIGKGWSVGTESASYFDEVRISNIARWTNNFTPPTRPY